MSVRDITFMKKIFLRDHIVKEIKNKLQTTCKDTKKHIHNCLFKNSYILRDLMRKRSRDFRRKRDIYYLYMHEFIEIFGEEYLITYDGFRILFDKYFPEWEKEKCKK